MRIVLAAAAAVLVTGCGTAASEPSQPTATDLAFMELVIPQNESTLAAIALAARKSTLVEQVRSGYRAELAATRDLLANAGRPAISQHDGHDMPGMITASELEMIGKADGSAFDRQLEALLRTQFEESRTVARAELSAGTAKPVLELGARIERTRTEFLALLGTP